ncbi:MAG: InlB B-repeat-containing protein, partial [Oscillospiraceae bacterium]|nr:InlB B-repeat-containing protein [Oscillospiraceae bacterium]
TTTQVIPTFSTTTTQVITTLPTTTTANPISPVSVQLIARETDNWTTFRSSSLELVGAKTYTLTVNTNGSKSLANLSLSATNATFEENAPMANAVKAPTVWKNALVNIDKIVINDTVEIGNTYGNSNLVDSGYAPTEGYVNADLWNGWSELNRRLTGITHVNNPHSGVEFAVPSVSAINSVTITFTVSGLPVSTGTTVSSTTSDTSQTTTTTTSNTTVTTTLETTTTTTSATTTTSETTTTTATTTAIQLFVIEFDCNDETSGTNLTEIAPYGAVITPPSVGERDYYTFKGWFTSPSGGLSAGTITATKDTTFYAQWELNPIVTEWTDIDSIPNGAKPVNYRWSYSKAETMSSYNQTEPGWTKTGEEWVQSGTGTQKWANFHGGFDRNNSLYNAYNGKKVAASETATTKRTVTDSRVSYIYWHWCYPLNPPASAYNRIISDTYNYFVSGAGNTTLFGAYESTDNAEWVDSANAFRWRVGGSYNDTQGSHWWFRTDVMQSNYTDFKKRFDWKKDEVITTDSTTESTARPSGTGISNIQEQVQYREK